MKLKLCRVYVSYHIVKINIINFNIGNVALKASIVAVCLSSERDIIKSLS